MKRYIFALLLPLLLTASCQSATSAVTQAKLGIRQADLNQFAESLAESDDNRLEPEQYKALILIYADCYADAADLDGLTRSQKSAKFWSSLGAHMGISALDFRRIRNSDPNLGAYTLLESAVEICQRHSSG